MVLSVLKVERKASREGGLAVETLGGYDAALGWLHALRTRV